MEDYHIVYGVLVLALAGFLWGKYRYELVALGALTALAAAGIVPADRVFSGFAHPAVITVAAVLVLSRGLANAGVVDALSAVLRRAGSRPTVQVFCLTSMVALASAFMNNVGALALLLPVALKMSADTKQPPSRLLMPLAFGSLLGGLLTLIGTPPNLIISSFRDASVQGSGGFGMFDFAPVGVAACGAGILFLSLIGWRLVPRREASSGASRLSVGEYLTEVRVPLESKHGRKPLSGIKPLRESGVVVVAIVRDGHRITAPAPGEVVVGGDVLVLEGEAESISDAAAKSQFELVGSKQLSEKDLVSEDIGIMETVVMPGSSLIGRTAIGANLRRLHDINLLAVARQGRRLRQRLGQIRFESGDVLLLQGRRDRMADTCGVLGLVPLQGRDLKVGKPPRLLLGVALFGGAILLATFGVASTALAFTVAALVMHVAGLLPVQEAYRAVDLPVIILLAAMMPVGEALETTGGAQEIANGLLVLGDGLSAPLLVLLVLLVAGLVTEVVNNAAAALLMAPIAVSLAQGSGVPPDLLLMTVAVGSSAAFLTPIGHQANMLVMGPGGYRFGDYWRVGLPLSAVVMAAATPVLLWKWG